MNRKAVRSLLVLSFIMLGSVVFAQQLATLKVTVTDQSGALVPGATVTVTNLDTGTKRTDVTDARGLSVIPDLAPGRYELSIEGKGFAVRKQQVTLAVAQTASLTAPLGIEVKQEVEVSETVQGIDPEKADVSQVIEERKIMDLPNFGRDFIDTVLLTPSVNVGRSTAVGAQSPFTETVLKLSFGGIRESHSSFYALDGADYTTSISGVPRISPSQDWVQEFRVVDSPYNSDTGRSLGSVVNTITKSGTNAVHGSAYEFFKNNKLNANNLLSAPGFNTDRFNQFGADVGGPIRKDKNFYFLGYEGQRSAESPIYGGFILHNIDSPPGCPINTINTMPAPNCLSINAVKRYFGLQPENLGSILQIDDYDKFIAKVNNTLSSSTFLNIEYLFNDSRKQNVRGAAPGEGLPSSYRDNPVRDQTIYGNMIHVFSHDLTTETILQYGRRTFHLDPKGAGLEPAISIPNLLFSGGFVGSVHFYQEQHFQSAENATWIKGNHTFKFGAEYQPVWTQSNVPLFSPGFGVFTPDSFFGTGVFAGPPSGPPIFNGTPRAVVFLFLEPQQFYNQQIAPRDPNFQAGLFAGPNQQAFTDATSLNYMHQLFSTYFQDQWKARPNLTFTFGMHYDIDFFPSASDVKIRGGFHPTNYNNVQPRVAFAYAMNGGKTVLRGGAGIFTAPFVYSDIMVSWIGASEFTYMQQPFLSEFNNPSANLIGFGASGAVGVPGPVLGAQAFTTFAQTGVYPTPLAVGGPGAVPVLQFPLGYAQKHFDNPYSEQASLELEHQIGKNWVVSAGYQWLHAMRLPVYLSINGDCPGHVEANCPHLPSGKEVFSGPADPNFGFVLYVKPIGFSLYNAGTLNVRKAFANNFNFLVNYTYSKSIDISTTVNLPNTPENYLHPERDRAVGDNDVRHRLTLAVQGESPQSWPRALRDFKLSLLTNLQSARYFTVNAAPPQGDLNGDGFTFPDRMGNLSRNTYKGDPYYDVDLRLQRVIPFSERFKGEASAEVFNLFNRVNVLDVNHLYVTPSPTGDFVGPVPQNYGDHITDASGTFGTPKFVGPARQFQLSFRVLF